MSKRKIILYTNVDTDKNFSVTKRVGEILRKSGCQTVLCPISIEDSVQVDISNIPTPSGYKVTNIENISHYFIQFVESVRFRLL